MCFVFAAGIGCTHTGVLMMRLSGQLFLAHLLVLLIGCKLYGGVGEDTNHIGPIALHVEGGGGGGGERERWTRCCHAHVYLIPG